MSIKARIQELRLWTDAYFKGQELYEEAHKKMSFCAEGTFEWKQARNDSVDSKFHMQEARKQIDRILDRE